MCSMFGDRLGCLASPRVALGVKRWPGGPALIALWQVCMAIQAGAEVRPALEGWELPSPGAEMSVQG